MCICIIGAGYPRTKNTDSSNRSIWEIMWISGPVFVVMMFFFPETSAQNILLRRAARLRKLTGNPNLKAQSEIDQAKLSAAEVVTISLWRPIQINFLDPAVAFTSLYISLVYAIFYSFFEVFPLVYGPGPDGYGLNAGQIGLIFLNIIVGVVISIPAYFAFLHYHLEPKMKKHGFGAPEERLIPALFASFLTPIGLFMFAVSTGETRSLFLLNVHKLPETCARRSP